MSNFVIADRVKETTTSINTGNITLAGAPTGFQTFASQMQAGDTCGYAIDNGAEWEVGIGTLIDSVTLGRTTVLASSNHGSLVAFSAGTKSVFLTVPASKIVDPAKLSKIATSGSYADLLNTPAPYSLPAATSTALGGVKVGAGLTVAADGTIAATATTDYNSLTNKPVLATVATSGSYADLLNKPTLFSGSYTDLTNKPTLFDGKYSSLTGAPLLATVATSGSYADLLNKPTLFSGSYTDLTNKPTIPTQYTDANARAAISVSGSLAYNATTGVISYTAPTLATVATSGSYTDLTNKPTIPTQYTDSNARAAISVTGSLAYNSTTGVISYTAPTLATVATTGSYNDLTNLPAAYSLPVSSTSTLGGVKVGTGLSADANGVLSLTLGTSASPLNMGATYAAGAPVNAPTIDNFWLGSSVKATAPSWYTFQDLIDIEANGKDANGNVQNSPKNVVVNTDMLYNAIQGFFGDMTQWPTAPYYTDLNSQFNTQKSVANTGLNTIGSNYTMSAGLAGSTLVATAANITLTLPASSVLKSGSRFIIVSQGNNVMIKAATGDTMKFGASTGSFIVLSTSDTLMLVCDTNNKIWYAFGGTAMLPYSGTLAGANFVTPAQFDSSATFATTQFVQRALGNKQNNTSISSATTLTAADVGKAFAITAAVAVTLPLANSVSAGSMFYFRSSANGATVVRNSANTDTINPVGASTLTKVTVNNGDTLELISDGSNWSLCGGSASLPYAYTAGNMAIGMRNRIINGDMRVDQRFNGSSASVSATSAYVADRWNIACGGTAAATVQRVSNDGPSYFMHNSLKIVTSTAYTPDATLTGCHVFQPIEKYNVADLMYGVASAQAVTVSFWCKSTIAGKYSTFLYVGDGALVNSAYTTRTCVMNFTINSANTWEYKTVTFPADTAAANWFNIADNAAGVLWGIDLGSGTNRGTSNTGVWQESSNGYVKTPDSVNLFATVNAQFNLSAVQLEVGTAPTPFQFRSYADELRLCQRYYEKVDGTAIAGLAPYQLAFFYKVTKRVGSTLSVISNVTNATFDNGAGGAWNGQIAVRISNSPSGTGDFTVAASAEL